MTLRETERQEPAATLQTGGKRGAALVTGEARDYALWELSRRAGVTRDQFEAWRIDHRHDRDVIWINGESPQRIEFPVAPTEFWDKLGTWQIEVARTSWMFPPSATVQTAIRDFVVPFSSDAKNGRPLFQVIDSTTVACSVDLLTSLLLTLSRYEEVISETRDVHGRFPASASLAVKYGFLERPIVDEYGFALQQALSYIMPGFTAPARELRVKLSHDIDEVGMPFRIRPVVGHTLARRNPIATLRDLASVLGAGEATYLNCVRKLCKISIESGLDSALYWKASPYSDYDSGYSISDKKIQSVIRWAQDKGIEMGAHPGYYTYHSLGALKQQFQDIQAAVGCRLIGGRQHYLRWSCQTWEDWEACGAAYDSTLGYADAIGFRAGTCIPYKPWLLSAAREANLLEIPLTVMDVTVAPYPGGPEEQYERIMSIVQKCRLVGGVFTLLWHNNSLVAPCYGDTYIRLIRHLAGARRFAWEEESRAASQPNNLYLSPMVS
jgi:hypothetical protein